jgi:hypothetical protein
VNDEPALLMWFGGSWGSPGNSMFPVVDVPAGEPCATCGRTFTEADQGIRLPLGDGWESYHRRCWAPTRLALELKREELDEFGSPD